MSLIKENDPTFSFYTVLEKLVLLELIKIEFEDYLNKNFSDILNEKPREVVKPLNIQSIFSKLKPKQKD